MMKNRERFHWAAELLQIKPSNHILEIGCGVGFAVETITPFLSSGKIIAIDRSSSAISRAIDRNQDAIATGKAAFVKTDLLTYVDVNSRYDKIFCFNINLFWTRKSIGPEMDAIKSLLKKNGSLYVLYGPVVASSFEKISKPISENLTKEKFEIVKTVHDDRLKCCCFIVRPT